jgi:hypothetical protein
VPCDLSNNVTLIDWAGEAKTPDELYQIMKDKKVTHILFNAPEARRLKSVDLMHFEKGQLKMFGLFWMKYIKEVHRTIGDTEILKRGVLSLKNQVPEFWNAQYAVNPLNYVYLYEILSESDAGKPHQVPINLFLSKDMYPDRRWENMQSVPQEIQNEFISGKYRQ